MSLIILVDRRLRDRWVRPPASEPSFWYKISVLEEVIGGEPILVELEEPMQLAETTENGDLYCTWQSLFENEIHNKGINHVWSFYVDDHLQEQQGYLQYIQHTFASFQCSRCGRRWYSAQVHILFLIRRNAKSWCGTVHMRIFRQRCRQCNGLTFEMPKISQENSKRLIINLVSKIQSTIYQWKPRRPPLEPEVYSDDVEGPHEKKYCKACKMKVCPRKAVSEVKTAIAMPTSRVGKPNEENVWTKDTTVGHKLKVIGCIICLVFLFLLVLFVISITK
ncbi:receptor-transporting protein 3-like [Dendrobates tinctorius]|uniref:receptor-transporting protein 3-like n=1 Tax=Dendrobates tinctorius TaxID=92724 RepID=UPI003CCA3626